MTFFRFSVLAVLVALFVLPFSPVAAQDREQVKEINVVFGALAHLKSFYQQERITPAGRLNVALEGVQKALKAHGVDHAPTAIKDDTSEAAAKEAFTAEFEKAVAIAKTKGVDAITLAFSASKTMYESLNDSHTKFIDPVTYKNFNENRVAGEYDGIGVTVQKLEDGFFYIDRVFPGGPAANTGVRRFDRLMAVNGKNVDGAALQNDLSKVLGEIRNVDRPTLDVKRGDDNYTFSMNAARGRVPLVESEVINQNGKKIAYVRVSSFLDFLGVDFFREVMKVMGRDLKELNDIDKLIELVQREELQEVVEVARQFLFDGVDGLVLDLRGNPGGTLIFMYIVASALLEEGSMVVTLKGDGEIPSALPSLPGMPEMKMPEFPGQKLPPEGQVMRTPEPSKTIGLLKLPLITARLAVLTDGHSASAAELTAAALQDHKRAIVVGETTSGMCNAAIIRPLLYGAATMVSVAETYRASGDTIEGKGVVPDVAVQLTKEDITAQRDTQLQKALELLTKEEKKEEGKKDNEH